MHSGGQSIWPFHDVGKPYQARVSTMEEAVKQLAPLSPTRPNWLYALVWLNMDACHVPLPKEGHLSILMEGGTSSAACRWISQLDVCQLLSLSSQVIYPVGLNGCEILVIMSLSKSLAKGTTMLGGKPIYLSVDIPQSATKGQESKALSPGGHSIPILTTTPIRVPLPKAEGQVSMTTEVRELLSQALSDTSGQTLGGSTPKRVELMALVMPEEVPATYSPTIETPGPSSDVPPLDIAYLCKEANKALGDWLAVKSSIDAHSWKLVSQFSMTLCQNESKTEESIKEAKALCTHSIKEAETNCAHSIKEAEAHCSTAIRGVEALGASQASSIQQSHAKGIQHLEEEAVKEESKGQLNFLSACQATLEASPLKSCGMLLASYQVLLGHTPMSHLFNIPQGVSPSQQGPDPELLPLLHLGPHPGPSDGITHQILWTSCLLARLHPRQLSSSKWQENNTSSQSVDKKLSGGIWPRHPSGKKDKGGILQEPLPKLQQ